MAKSKSPKERPERGEPATPGRAPRYDDRPEAVRGPAQEAPRNPGLPSYGDVERGDPRRSRFEDAHTDPDAEGEREAEEELGFPPGDDDEEEES